MFVTNCVIDHLWHIVPGGHYQRMFGEDLNPHVYKLMPSICDHIHWGGGHWTSSRAPQRTPHVSGGSSDDYHIHSEAGGGHAHAGCMIYLGDNWPARYRGGVFMCNLHGNRINHDVLERNGSTYVARHGKDFMLANDPWFRGLSIQYGPDGGVYVSDWCDTGECHNYQVADKTNGRIYKITYGDVKPWKGDLAKLSDLELAKLHVESETNAWLVRHARRILQERAHERKVDLEATKYLRDALGRFGKLEIFRNKRARLGSFWTLRVIKMMPESMLHEFLEDHDEHMRAWAVRFILEEGLKDETAPTWLRKCARDRSPLVRLHIASSLQRAGMKVRIGINYELTRDAGGLSDPYLPLMLWYAVEPIVERSPDIAHLVLDRNQLPTVRQLIARRWTELALKKDAWRLGSLLGVAGIARDNAIDRDVLAGIQDGLAGRKLVKMPFGWKEFYPTLVESPLPEVRDRAIALAVQFGDDRALTLLRKTVADQTRSASEREKSLKVLLFQANPDVPPMLHTLLDDPAMRRPAVRGLAAFDSNDTPALLLKRYPTWDEDEKADALQTLTSRPAFALALLDAIAAKRVPRSDVSQVTIRQMLALKNAEVSKRVEEVWGKVSAPGKDKAAQIAKYKAALGKETLKKGNLANGRALYVKHCAACHKLFGEGGDVGPDLTGSQRANLDYLLENVLDPSAVVPNEYKVTIVETKNGRTLAGIIKSETPAAITVQLQNETVVVPKGDIESRTPTKMSMMPEGIFEQMRMDEVRDLVAYLANPVRK
jgi:putative heme-binding domain-containing protein